MLQSVCLSLMLSAVYKGSLSSSSGAANISAISWEMRDTARAVNFILLEAMYAVVLALIYYACATCNCENYSRAIIILLVGKYATYTIQGQTQFESESI